MRLFRLTILVLTLQTIAVYYVESVKIVPLNRRDAKPVVRIDKPSQTTTQVVTEHDFIKNRVVNPHDFDYVLNPGNEICRPQDGKSIFILVYVHSAPKNFKRRLSLRETWARRSMFRDMRLVFMMGDLAPEDHKTRNLLKLENQIYNDIVQETFLDAYRNLTYKGIMAMKWISEYCPNNQFILKVDDDIIANFFILLRHLGSIKRHSAVKNNTIMCLVWDGMGVIRDKGSKWYVSEDEYKGRSFSKYCSGSAYILTNDLPPRMYAKSFYVKFFWVDDFYITGLLADAVNATHEYFNSLYILANSLIEQRFMGKQSSYTLFGHLPGQASKIYNIWNHVIASELRHFPKMLRQDTFSIVGEGDFKYLRDFKWSSKLWEDVVKIKEDE